MWTIIYFIPLLPFVSGWLLLLLTEQFFALSLVNGVAQLVLFAFIVCLPIWRTGRMSYVDIGWPWGLTLIGVLTWIYGEGDSLRVAIISIAYIFAGSRMGLGAIKLLISGHLDKELPRYEFQKKRWSKAGKTNIALAMQIEAIMQGVANAAFLAFPAFIIASNPSEEISIFEMIGIVIWLVSFIMESVADVQKIKYLRAMKKSGARNTVCNIGLWRYSRHPNYFAEWMVWNALVIASIPSWMKLYPNMSVIIFVLVGVGLLLTSRIMYVTLVTYTGAVPSEYYSVQKRPAYKDYQQTTNMFFPGPTKQN
ncbi:MAG: DUF1295 domain-containing protein [Candidatus Neomarinimicrobiota bacterium]|nr:DUF1295 domain-containing protein [Candidatus Neomarinimicrobiota bacterium]